MPASVQFKTHFKKNMILKLLLTVVVLIHLVESKPQFGLGHKPAATTDDFLKSIQDFSQSIQKTSRELGFEEEPDDTTDDFLKNVQGVSQAIEKTSKEFNTAVVQGAAKAVIQTLDNVSTAVNKAADTAESVAELIENFLDFKNIFKKNYVSEAEEAIRSAIFEANKIFITAQNELLKLGNQTFTLAINFFGDWRYDEYLAILGVDLSQAPDNSVSTSPKRRARAADCDSPEEKDWRKEGAVTPVKNQMNCSSCWAFAAAGALESHFFIKNQKLANFSEQQFVDCSINGGEGCKKGFMNIAFEYSTKNGIISDEEYPYKGAENGKDHSCNKFSSDLKIERYETIPKGNEEELKDAVCRFGPVSIALDASSETFMHYKSGIYRNSECSTTQTTHGALVVGYGFDENTDEAYWIVKNSYSTSWGENGYIRIPRDFNNHCGIANLASYPVV